MNSLINERGKLKGQLTRFATHLNNLNNLHNGGAIVSKQDIFELKIRTKNASTLLEKYETVYQKITLESENTTDDDELLANFENMYYRQISLADALLDVLSRSGKDTPDRVSPTPSDGSNNSSNSIVFNDTQNKINLPKINLSKFNGEVDNWLEFKAIFQSMIHNNVSLSDINKLHYLKASLSNEPAEIIKSLDFTAENYSVSWNTLKKRYDQPKRIVKNNLSAIINIKALKQESSREIRKISDTLSKHVTSALSLSAPEKLFDAIIVHLISNKLDQATFREWEILANKSSNDLLSLNEFKRFLISHANFLENVEKRNSKFYQEKIKFTSKSLVTRKTICSHCNEEHFIALCPEFAKLTLQERSDKARELKLCFNCLSSNHLKNHCQSKYTCRTCKAKHHSLLHVNPRVAALVQPEIIETGEDAQEEPTQIISTFCSNTVQVLLPTASAKVCDSLGINHSVRILLDSGSQSNAVSAKFYKKLNLPAKHASVTVFGINNSNSVINSQCELKVSAHHSSFKIKLTCLVIDNITGSVPSFKVNRKHLKIPTDIILSDPSFDQPGDIDLLIGSPAFFKLLCIGQRSLGHDLPLLQKTHFGWVVSGPTTTALATQVRCHLNTALEVQDQLAKFWELESYPEEKVLSPEENACEAHYVQNTRRNSEGRFIVKIPFKESPQLLGDSLPAAKQRFLALERRLRANEELQKRYITFMQEYVDLNHMTLANPSRENSYYLPHHGVLKEDSLTTKLRVVFNGSSATTTGHSLNSLQMVGPTIQQSLFTILLRFRQHLYAISADVEKMYRQVLIHPDQRHLQRILWRSSVEQPIATYDLNTVTYGTSSASFLAIRSLFQLGIECEKSSPLVSSIIKNDFYVYDLLSGTDNIDDAKRICAELNDALAAGCFKLRKWISNDPKVLENIPTTDFRPGLLDFGDHEQARTTGPLTPDELFNSLKILVNLSQQDSFPDEYKQLCKGKHLKTTSSVLSLNPFLDSENLIRVGGRLINSNYSYNKKHPFLISGKHHLAKLIARREHLRLLHAGPQLPLCSLRDKFWITSGRNLVKQIVHSCVTCFRATPSVTRPIMGNLPLERITSSQPFNVTGIDYAGPIPYKLSKGRGSKIDKSYLCIFICFASKAIHLELVTSLSTDAFILALRRFISRRGKPSHIHSDNGTTFVGANSKLRELGKFLKEQSPGITETFSNEGITWHFIPAHSPHFGGLWESGVKSCKSHLKRILRGSILTFEELCTLLCQIEAILNSRPIAPLSPDPNDLQPLTPGHFLIGRALTSLPSPDLTEVPDNRLAYFQRIQSMHQHFWKRWSKEYVSELQQRTKWKNHHSDLVAGSLVLVKDDHLPPFKWRLGRVITLHPGTDNINRVATLQTSGGLIRRSFAKICPLPIS